MMKARLSSFRYAFSDIFNTRDDMAKGRVINLTCTLLTAVYNVFITGIFYTGFLTMNDINISGSGVVMMIPYVANLFSIFSEKVLSRFKHRKIAMIGAKIYFYFMYIIATTIMPRFIAGPDARLVAFVIILFLAYAVYAPFSPGITVWFYQFFPKDNERRTRYLLLCQVFSSIMSTIILLCSGIITDAFKRSGNQETIIVILRFVAFGLVLLETMIQLRAKDFTPPSHGNLKLGEVFTMPLRYRKFLMCMIMMFCWNFIANLNNGLWGYHLLNHMKFDYTLINLMSVMYTVILLTTSGVWRRVLRRYSWIRTFGIACLLWVPTEIVFFFMTPQRPWIYVPTCFVQNLLSVGLNLSYANILYMNLPEDHSTAAIAFNAIGCNVCAFLGLMTGTYVSSLTGDTTVRMMGMDLYSVQFTTLMRAVTILAMGLILFFRWRAFTREEDIEAVERDDAAHKAVKAQRPPLTARDLIAVLKRAVKKTLKKA